MSFEITKTPGLGLNLILVGTRNYADAVNENIGKIDAALRQNDKDKKDLRTTVNQLDQRIDLIVAQFGGDNTEIVDACNGISDKVHISYLFCLPTPISCFSPV